MGDRSASYDRMNFSDTSIDLTMETRAPEHIEEPLGALREAGYVFERVV